jgi:hypothetical protein
MGTTSGDHRMAIDPTVGDHTLTLTDDHGRSLRHSFAIVSRKEN